METSNSPFILSYASNALVVDNDLLRLSGQFPIADVRNAIARLMGKSLHFDFMASSLNFDLNQRALTADQQFTADLQMEASIIGAIKLDDVEYSPTAFNMLLKEIYQNAKVLPLTDAAYLQSLREVIPSSLRDLLEGFVFREWETEISNQGTEDESITHNFVENLSIRFLLHQEAPFDATADEGFNGKQSLCLASRKSSDYSKWHLKVRFSQDPADERSNIHPGRFVPGLYYPSLTLRGSLGAFTEEDEELDFGNDQISISHEVMILPALSSIVTSISTTTDPSPVTTITTTGATDAVNNVTNTIGKVANDISDTILNIGNNLAAKLAGSFKTQLQPVGSPISKDIALWVMIKKGTDDLGFDKFQKYMDAVFCGDTKSESMAIANKVRGTNADLDTRRKLPFPSVDAYRSIKVATEAFVMVNCMANDGGFDQEDLEDLSAKVPLNNGIPDPQALDHFWDNYLVKVRGTDVEMLPYLAVIKNKFGESEIKTSTFESAFNTYISGNSFATGKCYGVIEEKLAQPCFLELIWSYWIEESMMVQGLKAISRRFQNIKAPGANDPLANLHIDPLRPLSNLMWGYIQDEQHRLTVMRRGFEYNGHYGITPYGKALQNMRFADSRSKFMEAFHTMLNMVNKFYKQADDMTVKPDAFPILNTLKETHLILSEGAHNQFGDLPFVARTEMLMEQWLLSRSEFREFLPTRIMVAYPEPWMDRVSALNNLMGWTNASVLHFRDLARFGEQILLSVRYGNWANINNTSSAANWAHFWREQIQGYIHAYRAVTGVDLTAELQGGRRIDAQQPSVHLKRRLTEQLGNRQNGAARHNGVHKTAYADMDDI
jgi:hypothetical protein